MKHLPHHFFEAGYSTFAVLQPRTELVHKRTITTKAEMMGWFRRGMNLGLWATKFPAIELDISDAQTVAGLIALITDTLGLTMIRHGYHVPRALLVYRSEQPLLPLDMEAYHIPRNRLDHVRMVGAGQPFAVIGSSKQGAGYKWSNVIAPTDLPLVTSKDMLGMFDGIAAHLNGLPTWKVEVPEPEEEDDPLEAVVDPHPDSGAVEAGIVAPPEPILPVLVKRAEEQAVLRSFLLDHYEISGVQRDFVASAEIMVRWNAVHEEQLDTQRLHVLMKAVIQVGGGRLDHGRRKLRQPGEGPAIYKNARGVIGLRLKAQ